MRDGPFTSMSEVDEERFEAIFGPSRKVGRDGPSSGRLHPVAVPDFVPSGRTEADTRRAMDSMGEHLHSQGATPDNIRRITRQAALRKDARDAGRPSNSVKLSNKDG